MCWFYMDTPHHTKSLRLITPHADRPTSLKSRHRSLREGQHPGALPPRQGRPARRRHRDGGPPVRDDVDVQCTCRLSAVYAWARSRSYLTNQRKRLLSIHINSFEPYPGQEEEDFFRGQATPLDNVKTMKVADCFITPREMVRTVVWMDVDGYVRVLGRQSDVDTYVYRPPALNGSGPFPLTLAITHTHTTGGGEVARHVRHLGPRFLDGAVYPQGMMCGSSATLWRSGLSSGVSLFRPWLSWIGKGGGQRLTICFHSLLFSK